MTMMFNCSIPAAVTFSNKMNRCGMDVELGLVLPIAGRLDVVADEEIVEKFMMCIELFSELTNVEYRLDALVHEIRNAIAVSKHASEVLTFEKCMRNETFFLHFLKSLSKKFNQNWLIVDYDVARFVMNTSKFKVQDILINLL